jgi:hypothetical protein
MEHPPSNYKASIPLSYYQMWEVYKAINARISDWISTGYLEQKGEEISALMEINALLEKHITTAVEDWEDKVVAEESALLNDEQKWQEFDSYE